MQGALMAATVANGGKQMRPYLVQQLLGSDRRTIYTASPQTLRTPINGDVASKLQDMMVSVVRERHRQEGPDQRLQGRRQDRYGAERRRRRPARLVHRLRLQRQG